MCYELLASLSMFVYLPNILIDGFYVFYLFQALFSLGTLWVQ